MKKSVHLLLILASLMFVYAATDVQEYIRIYFNGKANQVQILAGSVDPSASSGVAAPIGSEYLRDNGDSFKKVGSADTAWIRQLNTSTPAGLELFEDPSFEKSVSSYCVSDNTAPFLTSNTSLKSPNNKKGTRINLKESGVTNYTCTIPVSAAYEGTPIRHKGWLTLWSNGNFSCSIVAQWNGADVGNAQIITSSQNIYYDLEVVPTGAGDTGFKLSCNNPTADTTYFVIHDETSNKAEKLSPVLADVKRTQSETLLNVGNLTTSSNLASFSVANDSGVRGIYTKSTAGLTFHQDAQVVISFYDYRGGSTALRNPTIFLDGVRKSGVYLTAGADITISFNVYAKSGQHITFSAVNATNTDSNIQISATATSPTIVMQNETFNSDLHLGAWVAQPNTATCSSAVIEGEANVGKWTTCSYAINTNTRSGCTTRPTQTDSEARSQGIRIYTRAYNAASTCAEPALVYVNVGTRYKGNSLNLYKGTSRDVVGETRLLSGTNFQFGISRNIYNPSKGTLFLDSGWTIDSNMTTSSFLFDDISTQNNGYLVINASKNPSMSGVNVGRVYFEGRGNAGQTITVNSTEIPYIKTKDTHNAWSGTQYTIPESGLYNISMSANFTASVSLGLSLNINGVLDKYIGYVSSNGIVYGNTVATFNKGDSISFKTSGAGGTLSNNTQGHVITISRVGF